MGKKKQYLTKIGGIFLLSLSFIALTACNNSSNDDQQSSATSESQEVISNKHNTQGLLSALESNDSTRFKMVQGKGGETRIVSDFIIMDETYGYDQETVGISTIAFCSKNKLNNSQANALYDLLSNSVDDSGASIYDIWDYYPEFTSNGFPNQTSSVDYATISDLSTTEENNLLKIKGVITVNLHLSDGTTHQHVYSGEVIPDASEEPIPQKKVDSALNAEVMNEEVPYIN